MSGWDMPIGPAYIASHAGQPVSLPLYTNQSTPVSINMGSAYRLAFGMDFILSEDCGQADKTERGFYNQDSSRLDSGSPDSFCSDRSSSVSPPPFATRRSFIQATPINTHYLFLRSLPSPLPSPWSPFPLSRTTLHKHKTNRKSRTPFTSSQLSKLEQEYLTKNYLTVGERDQLAEQLGLTETQVKIWLQNRRAKEKRMAGAKQEQTTSASQHCASIPFSLLPGYLASKVFF